MRFLLSLLLGPHLFWVLLAIIIYLFRGQILYFMELNTRQRAHLNFLKEQTLNRYDAKARFELGLNQFKWGNYPKAIILFQEAVTIDPDQHDCHYYLGLAYQRTKNFSLALAELTRCLELKPDYLYGQVWLKLGDICYQQRDFPGALAYYQKMLTVNPYEGEALYKIGLTYYNLAQKDEAKAYLNRAISEIKTLPHFRYNKDRQWLYKARLIKLFGRF